jgi:hypothetical protein
MVPWKQTTPGARTATSAAFATVPSFAASLAP